MRIACVIPARLRSTRLRHKPLRLLADQPLIRHVARRAVDLGVFDRVVVATDHPWVVDAVGGVVDTVLTAREHRNGTERVAEVVGRPGFGDVDVVVNLQGDEPFAAEAAVRGAVNRIVAGDEIGTAATPLEPGDAVRPEAVKVWLDTSGRACGFSRTLPRTGTTVYRHIGVYAYRPSTLIRWMQLPPVAAEGHAKLEQLRPLAAGMTIGVAVVPGPVRPGIDTPDELREAAQHLAVTC